MSLSDDGKTYTIKSSINPRSVVDLKFHQEAPPMVCGRDGTTTFGTDPAQPWGKMYHKFWPECRVEGQILTQEGPVDFKGRGIFIHCLQGMKPHFAGESASFLPICGNEIERSRTDKTMCPKAAKWNFCNFQSPSYSALLMSFTTPPSYGPSTVSVGVVVNTKTHEILFAATDSEATVTHTTVKGDPENDWPEPSAAKFTWSGQTAEGKPANAVVEGELGERNDRVDVMGEVPKFVKQIVAGAAGTKPYIYQYCPKMTIKVDVGGEVVEEEGRLFMEATFIS